MRVCDSRHALNLGVMCLSEIVFQQSANSVVCDRVCLVYTAIGFHSAVANCCGLVLKTTLHCIVCVQHAGCYAPETIDVFVTAYIHH